jgi:hypothetical protein
MIIKSIKTSELYVIGFVLAIWGIDRLGIDVGQVLAVLLDLRTTAADVARELQGIEEPQGTAGYWLAAAWLAARTALKVRGGGGSIAGGGEAGQRRRHDPYRAWQQPADQQQARREGEPGVRQQIPPADD